MDDRQLITNFVAENVKKQKTLIYNHSIIN